MLSCEEEFEGSGMRKKGIKKKKKKEEICTMYCRDDNIQFELTLVNRCKYLARTKTSGSRTLLSCSEFILSKHSG